MNKQEIIKSEKDKYERSFVILNSLPENSNISFISGENVFMGDSPTFNDFLSEFDKFGVADIEIDSYYISDQALAIKCLYKSFNVIFFCSEIEKALNELSNGTCEISQEVSSKTEKVINCRLT